jgi:hypothetical protein
MAVLPRLLLGVLLLAAAAACGGDDDGGGGGDAGAPTPDADFNPELSQVFPRVAYGGYDGGGHTFRVPVSTDLSNRAPGEVTWSSDDEDIVTIEAVDAPEDAAIARGTWAMVTTTGSGQATISATNGEYTVTAEIVVAAYDAGDVDIGDDRYHTEETGDRVACASCHEAAGGADHTPTEMAFHDDDALLLVATEGHYPDICTDDDTGEPCTCDTAGCETEPGYVLGLDHTWAFTEDEADGIIPYLRSLSPRGFD